VEEILNLHERGSAMAQEKKQANGKLKELLNGPWPSFVKEIETAAQKSAMSGDLLGLLERSYNDRVGHWKHGGIVGVRGYGGGVIGRYCDLPEEFPNVSQFHTLRVNQPAGWFYTSEKVRKICDIWEKHGSGLTNMHGSAGYHNGGTGTYFF
jgi:sulfite reductase alpha subunit